MNHIYKDMYKKYLQSGYSAIPDKYKAKQPAIKGWSDFCHTQPTVDQATEWVNNMNTSNIAVCMGPASGVIALDFDCDNSKIVAAIKHLLPPSPVEKRSSKPGRFTRFFRYMGEVTQSVKFNGEVVVELLSVGKKTTIPPSIHPNGDSYKWVDRTLLNTMQSELPVLPPMLFSHIEDKIRVLFGDVTASAGGMKSGRHANLTTLASKLISQRTDVHAAVEKLVQSDKEMHNPPLFSDPTENRHIEPYSNALKYYADHLNSINSKRDREGKDYEIPYIAMQASAPVIITDKPERMHINAPTPKGTLKLIIDYILENSFVKQPNFAFSAALAVFATAVSRKAIFQGVSPNLYILNVAASGGGKDAPQQSIKRIIDACDVAGMLGSGDYVSDASLMDTLTSNPVRLDIVDEASGLLSAANRGKGDHNSKMADVLCELFTCSNDRFLGRMKALGKKTKEGFEGGRIGEAIRPNVNIIASTTPKGVEQSISRTSIDKGLVGRFMIFFGEHDRPAHRVPKLAPVPEKVVEDLKFWFNLKPAEMKGVVGLDSKYFEVEATDEANTILDTYFKEVDDMRRGSDQNSPLLPIISRMYQMLLKVALLHAASREPHKIPLVNKTDVEFAHKTVEYYYGIMKSMVENHIFDSWHEGNVKKFMNYVDNCPDRRATKAMIKRNLPGLNKRKFDEILDDLRESGRIIEVSVMEGNKRVTYLQGIE